MYKGPINFSLSFYRSFYKSFVFLVSIHIWFSKALKIIIIADVVYTQTKSHNQFLLVRI